MYSGVLSLGGETFQPSTPRRGLFSEGTRKEGDAVVTGSGAGAGAGAGHTSLDLELELVTVQLLLECLFSLLLLRSSQLWRSGGRRPPPREPPRARSPGRLWTVLRRCSPRALSSPQVHLPMARARQALQWFRVTIWIRDDWLVIPLRQTSAHATTAPTGDHGPALALPPPRRRRRHRRTVSLALVLRRVPESARDAAGAPPFMRAPGRGAVGEVPDRQYKRHLQSRSRSRSGSGSGSGSGSDIPPSRRP